MNVKQFKNRVAFFLITFTLLFFILAGRLVWIDFVNGDEYRKKVYSQQSQSGYIAANRGTIYDRNYMDLAVSSIAYNISIEPVKINDKDIEKILSILVKELGVSEKELEKIINNKTKKYYSIEKKVDKEIGEKIQNYKNKNDITGLNIEKTTKRYYPQKNLAAHIIGFTGIDNQGLEGIEDVMDSDLKGVPGKITGETDAKGNESPFSENGSIEAKNGFNVVLTIDKTIQSIAEEALEKTMDTYEVENGGVAIVMDPSNGDILAMTSKPDFNLNEPFKKPELGSFDDIKWDTSSKESIEILQETVWRNRAVMDTYEPGSTFKAITSAIGLEEDVIESDSMVNDYTVTISGYDINCWEPNAHGEETFTEGVYNSCNPVFVNLALDVGIEAFYKYIKAFGFYDETDIDLPGEATSIFHNDPQEIDLAVASFGQRFQVTPIQMITAYGAIANGGNLVKPRLVKELTDSEGNIVEKIEPDIIRNVISQETSDTLRDILEGVVSKGTGMNAYVSGYRVAGKTGTSETTETETDERYIASFAAFAPADNPVICVLVVVDNPRKEDAYFGGVVAAPVVSEIIEGTLEYMGVKRRYDEDETTEEEYFELSDVRNIKINEAEELLKENGYKVIKITNDEANEVVVEQIPKPNSELSEGSTVVLYTNSKTEKERVEVPDLSGLSVDEVKNKLDSLNLNLIVHGKGTASNQSITAGIEVNKGRVISVDFIQQVKD